MTVKKILIRGNTLIDTATLRGLVQDAEGQQFSLTGLQQLTDRITNYYHAHGYPLSRAMLPAQNLDQGQVVIQVLEAHYGKVQLQNKSGASTALLQSTLDQLETGHDIEEKPLDRTLLLLSDTPGVQPSAQINAGASSGTTDIGVTVDDGRTWWGSLSMDNYGNNYIGNDRVGAGLNVAELLGLGDVLSVNGMTSGPGLRYERLGYELLADGEGTRVGAAISDLHYALGGAFGGLQADGSADVSSLWARHPLIRGREANLYLQGELDYLRLVDYTGITGATNNRHIDDGQVILNADEHDHWMGGVWCWPALPGPTDG